MRPWNGLCGRRATGTSFQSMGTSGHSQATRQPMVSPPARVEASDVSRAAGEDGTALVASPGPTMDDLKELLETLLGDIQHWQQYHGFPDLPPAFVLSQVAAMFSVDPPE